MDLMLLLDFGDMIAMGILDPAKVTRTALQAAGSVAGLMITTEAMISEIPKRRQPCQQVCLQEWAEWME